LAKGASANLTIFLALKDKAKFGTTSLVPRQPVFQRALMPFMNLKSTGYF
jgi:hypothetical protein